MDINQQLGGKKDVDVSTPAMLLIAAMICFTICFVAWVAFG